MELTLRDALLMSHDISWLMETSAMNGIQPDNDPVITAGNLAEHMLDPDNLAARMLVLNDDDISFFEYVIRTGSQWMNRWLSAPVPPDSSLR